MGMKERHGVLLFLSLSLYVILYFPLASALNVHENQQNMVLTLERGSTFEFLLLVENVDEPANIEASGEISDWITFGETREAVFAVYPNYFIIVPVTISVPAGTDMGEYQGSIEADGIRLSKLTIKVTLGLDDAIAYAKISNVDEEVGNLSDQVEALIGSLDDVRTQMATLEHEVSDKMNEIYDYQKNLTTLESEKNNLESENARLEEDLQTLLGKSQNLEESNQQLNEMTGMLVGTQLPGMFFGGIILGVFIIVTALKIGTIRKKRGRRLGGTADDEKTRREKFKYSFKGK